MSEQSQRNAPQASGKRKRRKNGAPLTTDLINAVAWDEGNRSARRRLNLEPSECWPQWTAEDYDIAAAKANEIFAAQIGAPDATPGGIRSRLAEIQWEEMHARGEV